MTGRRLASASARAMLGGCVSAPACAAGLDLVDGVLARERSSLHGADFPTA
jgi:hypothetical protein